MYVAGCMEGNCHYMEGNIWAKKRVKYVKKLLDQIGVGGDRLEMYNMSAAEGQRFAAVAAEMTEKIRQLGPSPVKRRSDGCASENSQEASIGAAERNTVEV